MNTITLSDWFIDGDYIDTPYGRYKWVSLYTSSHGVIASDGVNKYLLKYSEQRNANQTLATVR